MATTRVDDDRPATRRRRRTNVDRSLDPNGPNDPDESRAESRTRRLRRLAETRWRDNVRVVTVAPRSTATSNAAVDDTEGTIVRWGRTSWNVVGVVIVVYVAAIVIGRLRLVLVPVLVAVLIATQLVPLARFLERRGWPRLAAAWAAFLALIGSLVGIVDLIAPAVSSEIGNLGDTLSNSGQRFKTWLTDGPLDLSTKTVNDLYSSFDDQVTGNQSRLLHGALSTAPIVLEVVAAILLTFVLTFFFVKDGEVIVDRLVGMVRPRRRPGIRRFLDDSWHILTGYVRGSAVNGIVNAAVLSLALWIIGVPLIIPIAVLTVFGSFIPIVGGIASGGVATAVALVENGPTAAIVLVGVTILIHHLEGYIIGPLVMGRSVHLHPVAVIVGISDDEISDEDFVEA